MHCRSRVPILLASALVAAASLAAVRAPGQAQADQIGSLSAKAAAVSQQLVQEQLQVGAAQQQYAVATAKVAAESAAIQQVDIEISQDQQLISARDGTVRNQAIQAYTDYGSGSTGPEAQLFNGNQQRTQAASEYSSIAIGNITTALDQLHAAQRTLQNQQSVLTQQEEQARADQATRASALGQATATEGQLESLQSQVTGALAEAVTQQAAAQAAAAQAAVVAAQRAAAGSPSRTPTTASSTVTTAPASTGSSGVPAGGFPAIPDPALNPYLQCVVQAESGGDYSINTGNGYYGAFQFSAPTWNFAAQAAALPYLVGVLPSNAPKADQDTVAVALYALDGEKPWLGDRCS